MGGIPVLDFQVGKNLSHLSLECNKTKLATKHGPNRQVTSKTAVRTMSCFEGRVHQSR